MIALPYLLVLNVPLHRHDGGYWADPLWKKDLEAHRVEISDLALACPVIDGAPPPDWQRLADNGITIHPLPPMGRLAALLAPVIGARLRRAIAAARIVHIGVAGWPFPLGWLAAPIARAQRRALVVVIESAFWRIPPGTAASRLARWRAAAWEALNRRTIAACDVRFYTTQAYRETLDPGGRGAAHVLPAVWTDADQLIDLEALTSAAGRRQGRFLFAGRLTPGKGVETLLTAVERSGVAVDIVGTGELREAVLALAGRRPDLVRLIDPVDYGPAFVALLDGYAALIVPTLTDEQPRVIFDAFARGLAVIASATTGNGQVVADGRTGLLFAPGDVEALANALGAARGDPARIAVMGAAAHRDMAGRTHAAMHAGRALAVGKALAIAS